MKHTVLLITFLFLSVKLFSQSPKFTFGLTGELSSYYFGNKNNSGVYVANYRGKLNLSYGFSFFSKIKNGIYINSGFNVADKSVDMTANYWTLDSAMNLQTFESTSKINQIYLEFPVNFIFYFSDKSNFYFSSGALFSFQINSKLEYGSQLLTAFQNNGYLNQLFDYQLGFKKTLILLKGGVGYNLKFDNIFVFILPEAGFFLSKLYPDDTSNSLYLHSGKPLFYGINLQAQFKM